MAGHCLMLFCSLVSLSTLPMKECFNHLFWTSSYKLLSFFMNVTMFIRLNTASRRAIRVNIWLKNLINVFENLGSTKRYNICISHLKCGIQHLDISDSWTSLWQCVKQWHNVGCTRGSQPWFCEQCSYADPMYMPYTQPCC
jgi:hypothetical protein